MKVRLGSILEEFKAKPPADSNPEVLTLTERNGFVRQADRFSKRLATEDVSGYKYIELDDFAFNPYLLWAGAIARNDRFASGVISPLYPTFRVTPGNHAGYVERLVLSQQLISAYDNIAFGSVPRRRRSSVKDFLDLDVPALPPLDEQRRIAAILDKADEVRAGRREALTHLDTLTQSIFHSMFGDPILNERNWKVVSLDKLGRITTGNTPSRAVESNFGDFIEWIKTDNINIPGAVVGRAAEGLSESGATKARIVEAGSVLMTCIAGSPRVIGNVAIADRRVAFNQQINAFTPSEGPTYYWYGLLANIKRAVQAASTGGMTGLVSKSALAAIMAIETPLELQRTFATRVAAVERLKESHRKHLAELDALFASLQDRAFKGEL